jgi:hypothetical protein
MDVGAGCALAAMMSQPLDLALETCRAMSAKHVSFALCHGFKVSVSGGRKKLLSCVSARLAVAVPSVEPAIPNERSWSQGQLTDAYQANETASGLLTARVAVLHDTLGEGMTFLEGHSMHGSCIDTSGTTFERIRRWRGTLVCVANRVINEITNMCILARYTHSRVDIGVYINNIVSMTSWMEAKIAVKAQEFRLLLTGEAVEYIITIIRVQTRERERLFLQRYMRALSAPSHPFEVIANKMKALKTVITSRNERSKKTATAITCGICFDEFKPSHVVRTGCGHEFCATCISTWAKQRGIKSFIQCPCCRAEIDELSVGNKTEMKKVIAGLAPK